MEDHHHHGGTAGGQQTYSLFLTSRDSSAMDTVAMLPSNEFSAVTYKHLLCLHRGQDGSQVGLYNAHHDSKSWLGRCLIAIWLTHTYTYTHYQQSNALQSITP